MLARLAQILFYPELGFRLDEIAEILADPEARAADHLRRQRALVRERRALKQSQLRTTAYSKEDWVEIKRQADESIAGFASALRAGEPADRQAAMDLAEAHRTHISRWFYAGSHQMHRGLGELYVSDARYSEPWERIALRPRRDVANAQRAAGGRRVLLRR